LTSCAWASPTQTDKMYAASDGTRVSLVDGDAVRVENIMVLTEAEGSPARLFGAVVNDTNDPANVTVTVDGDFSVDLEVDAKSVVRLEEEADVFGNSPAAPGATVPVTFDYQGSVTRDVPVLDGTLEPYDQFLP
ncbi:MAG TPA: hypothetical protein GX743_12305, partial [Actinomycetales bacterium]|nr:hypothetical protein [Actinomycetales bacterium]